MGSKVYLNQRNQSEFVRHIIKVYLRNEAEFVTDLPVHRIERNLPKPILYRID